MTLARSLKFFMAAALVFGLVACGDDGDDGAPGPAGPGSTSALALRYLGNVRNPNAEFDAAAAEIVSFDPGTNQAFVVNAQSGLVDVFNVASPMAPAFVSSIDVAQAVADARGEVASTMALGAVNSVDIFDGVFAAAIEAAPKQNNGYVAFFQTSDSSFLAAVPAGALPDMVTFSPDGNWVLVANEGEPSGDYQIDPEGSVTAIDVSGGAASVMDSSATTIGFTDFNVGGPRAGELGDDVRISNVMGVTTVAQDLEPEYIAVSADSSRAFVALQENSAIAEIDLASLSITRIRGLGTKDHSLPGNELDASDDDDTINIRTWPVKGLFMPDAIASFDFAGTSYVVTANEGDGREYFYDTDEATCLSNGGLDFDEDDGCLAYLDEIRIKDIVDPDEVGASIEVDGLEQFPGAGVDTDGDMIDDIFEDDRLGRLTVIATEGVSNCDVTDGQPEAGCVYEELVAYGARSFSIFNADTGERVFDSGSDFERITADRLGSVGFNASNDDNDDFDSRSDAKGPEPEAVTLATLGGRHYAFVGLERVGGIMVYDITEPEAARFVQYLNPRDFSEDAQNGDDSYNPAAGDLGPEDIEYVAAENSPNGSPLLLVGNEISGTLAIYQLEVIDTE